MRSRRIGVLCVVGLALATAGIAIRAHNAFRYPIVYGFDSRANWRYIERLTQSWALPAPDADWSTAHPPLFYYASAALCRALGRPEKHDAVVLIRLISTLLGLLAVGLAVALVRRADPDDPRRALLAGALLLFLPAHIYVSAMLHEELLVSSLASLVVVGVAWDLMSPERPRRALLRAALWGLAGGLALLTKLTGLLVILAAAGAYALDGWRRRDARLAAGRVAVLLAVALVVGGWYYARNRVEYGYFYPYGLKTHRIMLSYPPGERRLGDYLRVPFATWTDPYALSPDLLRSVWGTTYISIWFDGHRHFLPTVRGAVNRAGTVILLLALLPTAAFFRGLGRGVMRAVESPRGPDPPLLLLVALTLAGYVVFSWRNPWFAVLKGSFLLGLSVPFAFYASEGLRWWARGSRARATAIGVWMGVLFLAVAAVFTQGVVFQKTDPPGFSWEREPRLVPPTADQKP
ncbi:MAG: phospholipid carrier-dependent glycosyltransferase [Myxococcales bacterium]|nr:phospholipid carrier-dependent glycosyltransferase [Myxococcales bacterium]